MPNFLDTLRPPSNVPLDKAAQDLAERTNDVIAAGCFLVEALAAGKPTATYLENWKRAYSELEASELRWADACARPGGEPRR